MLDYKFLLIYVHLSLLINANEEQDGKPIEGLDPCYVLNEQEFSRISGRQCQLLPIGDWSENVTHLVVADTGISEVITGTFDEYPSLLHLEAVRNEITTIEENSFRNLNGLTTLDLSHNKISYLYPRSLEGLDRLKTLILAGNSITILKNVSQGLSSSILPSLEHLDLSSNKLESVTEEDFFLVNSTTLRNLVLESCNLNYINPSSFLSVPNLKALNLANNELSKENLKDILENFLELEELDIRSVYNATAFLPMINNLGLKKFVMGGAEDLKIIRKEMFPFIPTLTSLSIVDSVIEDVEDYAFDNLPNLTSLILWPCIFKNLPKGILLSRLEYLSIRGNTTRPKRIYFEDHSFARMSNLRVLDVSYNFMINLKKGTFVGLTNLKHLNMRRCGIHSVEENTFDPLANLEWLDVTNNTVLARRMLINSIFPSLKSLKHLIYEYGKLENMDISVKPFRHLVNLEHLDLSHSNLSQIIPELFHGLKNLISVNLHDNQIRDWSQLTFQELKKLQSMNISSNFIVTVTDDMLKDFRRLKYVDISHNPFNCSCKLLPFLNWVNSTEVIVSKFFENNNERYSCDNPKEFLNATLYKAHVSLAKDCNMSPSFTALISIAIILIAILLAVVICYIYKLNAERKLWSEDKKNFIYDAFVSYSANDSDWVFNRLLPQLENNTSDLKLCVYDRDFVAGRGISECILDSIQCSRRTILILSNNFLQSPWCRFETDLAHHTLIDEDREGLLLIKLEDLNENLVSPQLSYLLRTKIYLAWSQDPKEQEVFWKKLHKALKCEKKERPLIEVAKIV